MENAFFGIEAVVEIDLPSVLPEADGKIVLLPLYRIRWLGFVANLAAKWIVCAEIRSRESHSDVILMIPDPSNNKEAMVIQSAALRPLTSKRRPVMTVFTLDLHTEPWPTGNGASGLCTQRLAAVLR
jgi:hypothetical protein